MENMTQTSQVYSSHSKDSYEMKDVKRDMEAVTGMLGHVIDEMKSEKTREYEEENGGNEYMSKLTLASDIVPTYGGLGDYGNVSNLFLAEQNKEINRDINHGFCESDKATAMGFSTQNLNMANADAVIRERVFQDGQTTRDQASANARFIESSLLSNRNLTERLADRMDGNFRAIDNRFCHVESIVSQNNLLLNQMSQANITNNVINAQLCKFTSITGCQPPVTPCGQ